MCTSLYKWGSGCQEDLIKLKG